MQLRDIVGISEWDVFQDLRDSASTTVQEIAIKRFFGKRKKGEVTPHTAFFTVCQKFIPKPDGKAGPAVDRPEFKLEFARASAPPQERNWLIYLRRHGESRTPDRLAAQTAVEGFGSCFWQSVYRAILESLVEMGGSGKTRVGLEKFGEKMKSFLKAADCAAVRSAANDHQTRRAPTIAPKPGSFWPEPWLR